MEKQQFQQFPQNETKNSSATPRNESLAGRRGLNPALFSEHGGDSRPIEGTSLNSLPHLMQTDQKINEMKTQISVMAEHFGRLSQQFNEFAKYSQQRFDKIHQSIQKLDQNDHQILNESTQKFARINDRFAERKSIDGKIQEMVDRHNSVIKSYEMRMSQMQKVMMEKENQILTMSAMINDAKMEMSRLKRL